MKQWCLLSPSLFQLHIDEVVDFVIQGGGAGIDISHTVIHTLLSTDDIVLVSNIQADIRGHQTSRL